MAGAIIQPGARIGRNVLVNTRAVVEHDCQIGDHCHIAPGAVLCGGVSVGEGAHVGAGAIVLGGVKLGAGSVVAAGAVVAKDVEAGVLCRRRPGIARMNGVFVVARRHGLDRDAAAHRSRQSATGPGRT